MTHSLTFTLAAWTDLIVPAIVVASVVGSWIHNALKKYSDERKAELGEDSGEFELMAARRREQLREAARQRPGLGGRSPSASQPDTAHLSMAERIARARAKAQQELHTQRPTRPTAQAQPLDPRRQEALAQRQAELRRRQQAALTQQQAQKQAQQRARQQAQQRARQQRAQTHAQAQAQARQRGLLIHEPVEAPQQTTPTVRRLVPSKPKAARRPVPELIPEVSVFNAARIGKLSLSDLRKAIVLNEVLGKPVALRETQSF